MTFPITPNPAIHNIPALDSGALTLQDVQWLEAQGLNFINGIAQAIAKALLGISILGVQPLQALADFAADPGGVISSVLIAFGRAGQGLPGFEAAMDDAAANVVAIQDLITGIGGTTIADVIAAITAASTDISILLNDLYDIFTGVPGAAGKTLADVVTVGNSFVTGAAGAATQFAALLTATGQSTIAGLAGLVNLPQLIIDGIANALGHSGTGHTVTQIIGYLEAFPASVITGALATANIPNLPASIITSGTFAAAQLQTLIDAVAQGFGASTGLSFSGLESALTALPAAQSILDAIANALGHSGTGHTASQVITYLEAFPASLVTGALATANIPNLPASIITSGTFAVAQLQSLVNAISVGFGGSSGVSFSTLQSSLGSVNTIVGAVDAELVSLEGEIISTLSGIGSGFTAVGNALAAIPFVNVLSPWLDNIGAGIQAFADSIVSGLNLDSTTDNNPAQAGQAGALIANAVNSVNTIATAVALTISNQAISNPAYFGIDPTAAVTLPLSSLSVSATTPTINVTQSTPCGGYIDTPNGGIAKAVSWLGDGTLTNITALYINLYSVNTTTKVSTYLWSSGNIISAVSGGAVALWNFANIPSANYVTTAQGQKYYAEIQVLGSGTYKIVGAAGSWLNANTNVVVGAQGATRTPATKLASVTALSPTNTKNPSWTITPVTGDNCITVDLSAYAAATAITAVGVTCGGVAMTQKTPALTNYMSSGDKGYVIQYEIHQTAFANYTAGTPLTIAVTTTGGGTSGSACIVQGVASTYSNISAVGSAAQSTGTGTSITQTVTGLTANSNTIIRSAIVGDGAVTFSSNNQNLVGTQPVVGVTNVEPILVQDQLAYATSVPFTGAMATGDFAASAFTLTSTLANPLQVPPGTVTFTDANNIPWFAMNGSAGISQHAPQVNKFIVAGSHTYTVPTWAQAAAAAGGVIKFDIVPIGAGGGGNSASSGIGNGGGAGSWNPITLTYTNAGGGVPLTTTTFTVVTGAGGAGGTSGGNGSNGAASTVTITGYGIQSASGGTHGANTTDGAGLSPGDETFNGAMYNGGLEQDNFGDGSSPGGGGSGGTSTAAGTGAPGAVFITVYQV